jgi:hypothetical protein
MNDDCLAGVKARAACYGGTARLDVLALLAECRRLREPPDASGLLPAAVLEGLREKVQEGALYRDEGRALVAHADALSALVRELYAVVADLHQDHGPAVAAYGRGRAEALEEVASAFESPLGLKGKSPPELRGIPYARLHELAAWVRALGPTRPPLPPHAAEAEAGRLREALRAVAAAGRNEAPYAALAEAVAAAREALGEGP